MAVLTAYQSVAVTGFFLPEADQPASYSNKSDNQFRLQLGNDPATYVDFTGQNFVYDGSGIPRGGAISSINIVNTGANLATISDLALPVDQFLDLARTDGTAAGALLFGGDDRYVLSGQDDYALGFAGNDQMFGAGSGDVLFGNQGADTLFGNLGNDTLYGGQGADIAYGGQNDDRVFGNLGDDILLGNLGVDTLFGGQGNDTLFGGQGDDVLSGDLGDDVLSGDLGADRLVFGQNSGRDLVQGFSQASGDRLDLGGQSYVFGAPNAGNAVLNLSGGGMIELAGVGQEQVNQGYFV